MSEFTAFILVDETSVDGEHDEATKIIIPVIESVDYLGNTSNQPVGISASSITILCANLLLIVLVLITIWLWLWILKLYKRIKCMKNLFKIQIKICV